MPSLATPITAKCNFLACDVMYLDQISILQVLVLKWKFIKDVHVNARGFLFKLMKFLNKEMAEIVNF